MSNSVDQESLTRLRAHVPWGDLLPEAILLFVGALAMALSFVLDACAKSAEFFARAGAIAVLCSAVVAYRSLNKHYIKLMNRNDPSEMLFTSKNQQALDKWTLALSIVGTIV